MPTYVANTSFITILDSNGMVQHKNRLKWFQNVFIFSFISITIYPKVSTRKPVCVCDSTCRLPYSLPPLTELCSGGVITGANLSGRQIARPGTLAAKCFAAF